MPQPAPAPMDAANEPPPMDTPASNEVDIAADATWTPLGGVTINNGGVAKFDVTYPTGMNTCTITFASVIFSFVADPDGTGSGTVKIGSGN